MLLKGKLKIISRDYASGILMDDNAGIRTYRKSRSVLDT